MLLLVNNVREQTPQKVKTHGIFKACGPGTVCNVHPFYKDLTMKLSRTSPFLSV